MFNFFVEHNPRQMPLYFFWRHVRLDYSSSVRADTSRQKYSVIARCWYIDATFLCDRCGEEFCFSAAEQKVWYEDYGFRVDSHAKDCRACREELRRLKSLRQEYDREIARTLRSQEVDRKARIVIVIDQLSEAGADLPIKVIENRQILTKQIARRSASTAG